VTDVSAHVRTINDCNQRGGRMLSLVDLIDAGTVDLPLAGYLAAVMQTGASVLVGAQPGGAGKTTVMCALLNFLPADVELRVVSSQGVLTRAIRRDGDGSACYLAHEISPARYYAYIWDAEARRFFQLAKQGHLIASNLHADTLDETREQLCGENGVDPELLDEVTLKLFIGTRRTGGWGMDRWISTVYESDGSGDRLVWSGSGLDQFSRSRGSAVISPEREEECQDFLRELVRSDTRTIPAVRRAVIEQEK